MKHTSAPKPAGLSLTQDAWRRFVRRPSSRVALAAFALVAVVAFLAPILPIQPPDRDRTKLAFAEPTAAPL
ncbi:MAG: hypothetical protein AAF596_07315, partial [Planctomycetota bacterium]